MLPWAEAMRWSPARREAALIAAGEAEGGRWRHDTWSWDIPAGGAG